MSDTLLAVVFALCAACCIAVGAVVRQRVAATIGDDQLGRLGAIDSLVRRPSWWLGTVVGVLGYVFQAAALGRGSVLLVQPLLVLSLLFALPLSARFAGHAVGRAQWIWAGLLTAAVAVLVVVGDPRPGRQHAELQHWLIVAAVAIPLVTIGLLLARRPGPRRALLLGVISGALFGFAAILTKGVVATAGHGVVAVLGSAETYALAVIGLSATALQQNAYQAGALQLSLPAATVAEPLVASLLGFLVLGEYLHVDAALVAVLVIAAVVMVVAAIQLARDAATPTPRPATAQTGNPQAANSRTRVAGVFQPKSRSSSS
ncbi:DMT family transporter [Skermania piniformis]|uniref:DMT family transporter n=1 Tax=Skermania pinensis TaxID=39122 RepID=A0ABX8S8Y0_9ACTN|nr:DMT family transporter [Skermania piniformis]QXQ14294.1 DMT family transporter [Skermania piniformis]